MKNPFLQPDLSLSADYFMYNNLNIFDEAMKNVSLIYYEYFLPYRHVQICYV